MKKILSVMIFILAFGFTYGCSDFSKDALGSDSEDGSYSPDDNLRYIVGFAPGGATDLTARTVVKTLNGEEIVDASINVENLEGAGGAKSLMEMKSKGDEDTLLQMVDIASAIYQGDADVTLDDFIPVAQVANNTLLLVVSPESGYESIEDFLDELKKNPEDVSIGLAGKTNQFEALKWNEIAEEYGIEGDLNFIPSGGTSEVIPEVLSGRIDAGLFVPPVVESYLDTGELKALGALSEVRLDFLTDIPTFQESDIDVTFYRPQGLFLKGDVSEEAVSYWEEKLEEMTETEEWKSFLDKQMFIDEYLTREEYTEWLEEEGEAYQKYLDSL